MVSYKKHGLHVKIQMGLLFVCLLKCTDTVNIVLVNVHKSVGLDQISYTYI